MNFLKKLGLILSRAGAFAADIMGIPFVGQLLGTNKSVTADIQTGVADLNSLAAIVGGVEATLAALVDPSAKTGSQKLTAAAPQVEALIMAWAQSNLPGHNKVKDQSKLTSGATSIASGMADVLSAFGD